MPTAVSYAGLFQESWRGPWGKQQGDWFSKCFGNSFYERLHVFCISFQAKIPEFRIVRVFDCAVIADGEVTAVHVNPADRIANAVFSIIRFYYFLTVFLTHAGQCIACGLGECGAKSLNFLIRLVRVQVDDLHFLIFRVRDQCSFIVSCFDAIFPKDGCV